MIFEQYSGSRIRIMKNLINKGFRSACFYNIFVKYFKLMYRKRIIVDGLWETLSTTGDA